jgi:hypothetical protein
MNIFYKLVFILFCLFLTISTAALWSETPETETNLSQKICSLTSNLSEGEACIWYLFHSGWAVKTRNHFLIFDYWEKPGKDEKKNLENGFINPEEVAGQKVTVFVSHAHSDHFDPIILSWKKKIPDIKYIWGWRDKSSESGFCFDSGRTAIDIGGMKIYNIHHEFDGIPESAFMVQVNGLWIFHAGDHGNSQVQSISCLPPPGVASFTPSKNFHLQWFFPCMTAGMKTSIRNSPKG